MTWALGNLAPLEKLLERAAFYDGRLESRAGPVALSQRQRGRLGGPFDGSAIMGAPQAQFLYQLWLNAACNSPSMGSEFVVPAKA